MKFTINTPVLKTALSKVNHATANISTTPILENILIKVHFKTIVFTANNLEMAIEHVVKDGITIDSEGSFCIPSKIFTNYIALIEDDQVTLELLSDHSLSIITNSSKTKIKGNPASDFPLIPSIKETITFGLPGNILKQAIEKTLFSAAEGNIRPTLAGIYMHLAGHTVYFATTDSFRLSEYSIEIIQAPSESCMQILPSKTAFQLKSLIETGGEIKVMIGDNQIAFLFENTKLYSRLLNGKFPDYTSYFPTTYNTKAIINRSDFIGELKKINLLSRETNYGIKMSISPETGILIETKETQM